MKKSQKEIAIIVAGATVGAVAGVLLAPEQGKETRKRIVKNLKFGGEHIMQTYDQLKNNILNFAGKKLQDFDTEFSTLLNKTEDRKEDVIASLEKKLLELKANTTLIPAVKK